MYLVNLVYDDEELLEPYEWQRDDTYIEYDDLHIYRVQKKVLHDFLYGKLYIEDCDDSFFIVGDGHYNVVIELKNHIIYRRGTLTLKQRDEVNHVMTSLSFTMFHYHILEEAYEKEFGLTRQERMKKICLEEVIDEIFVVHYEQFQDICLQLNIHEDNPHEQYMALNHKIEKGYSSLHELLYRELVQKR